MKLCLVTWTDAIGALSRWDFFTEMGKQDPTVIFSVGWLIRDDDVCVEIMPHINFDVDNSPQGCGNMIIPRSAVKKVVELPKKHWMGT